VPGGWLCNLHPTEMLNSVQVPWVKETHIYIQYLLWESKFPFVYLHIYTEHEIDFYIHGSVHRNSILIRSNKMQQYTGVYLLQNRSTCFGCPSHPSSGEHKTVTAASGTSHSVWATNFRPRWRKVVAQIL